MTWVRWLQTTTLTYHCYTFTTEQIFVTVNKILLYCKGNTVYIAVDYTSNKSDYHCAKLNININSKLILKENKEQRKLIFYD